MSVPISVPIARAISQYSNLNHACETTVLVLSFSAHIVCVQTSPVQTSQLVGESSCQNPKNSPDYWVGYNAVF